MEVSLQAHREAHLLRTYLAHSPLPVFSASFSTSFSSFCTGTLDKTTSTTSKRAIMGKILVLYETQTGKQ